MKKLKDIDFDANIVWMEQLTDKERKRLKLIFRKYIQLKYPYESLHEVREEDILNGFMDGLIVGMLDI